jgi:hypothetical protein
MGRLNVAELLVGLARAWPDELNPEDTLLQSPLMMTNREGNNPLHEAVRHHRTAVALALLDADHSRAYDLNEKMESPLHMAAREGLVHVVRKVFDFAWVEPAEYVPSVAVSGQRHGSAPGRARWTHQYVTWASTIIIGTHECDSMGCLVEVVEIMHEKQHAALVDMTPTPTATTRTTRRIRTCNSHMVELLLATKTQLAYSRNEDGQPRCTSPRSTARRTLSRRCSGTAPT